MIGIVILNYNTYDLTIRCVKSIVDKTKSDFKIYIVDNFSEDDSYIKFCNHFANNPKICILCSSVNGGYSKGNNLGIRKAKEDGVDVIAIVNSDTVLLNNAIDILYNYLLANENIDLVGPSIVSPDGIEQQFARRKLDLAGFIFDKKPFYYIKTCIPFFYPDRKMHWQNQGPVYSFSGMVSGCFFLIRLKLFDEIGFFDENVFLFGEEDILAYKFEQKQKEVAIISNAHILHSESSSINIKGSAFQRFHRTMSALYVLRAYAKLSNFAMLLAILVSSVPLLFFSIFNSSYRKFLKKILRQQYAILKKHPNI